MVAINFMKQFVPKIEDGTKIHTLRDKARCKVGDKLQLYYGQRTKQCRLIKEVVCTAVVPVEFIVTREFDVPKAHWTINGKKLSSFDCADLAFGEGFEVQSLMRDWFWINKGPQWSGYLIAWGAAMYLPKQKNGD